MARLLIKKHKLICIDDLVHLYNPVNNFYEPLISNRIDGKLRGLIPEVYKSSISTGYITEVLKWLLSEDIGIEIIDQEKIKKSRLYINFKNGTLDVATFKRVNNDKLIFLNYINVDFPFDYSPSNKYFNNYVKSTFDNDNRLIKRYQEFLGIALSNIRDLKLMFFLLGEQDSGKSVTLSFLRKIIGNCFVSSLSFHDIGGQFRTSELNGKTINLGSEIDRLTAKRLDILKSVTGNDQITAEYKGKDAFKLTCRALLVFACNRLPSLSQNEHANSILSRTEVIYFPKEFARGDVEGGWIDNLSEKLEADFSYIVYFAAKGLQRLIKNDFQLTAHAVCTDKKYGLMPQNAQFIEFLKKHTVPDTECKTSTDDINERYISFCEENAYTPLTITAWTKVLKMVTNLKKVRGITEANLRGYQGIRLKN